MNSLIVARGFPDRTLRKYILRNLRRAMGRIGQSVPSLFDFPMPADVPETAISAARSKSKFPGLLPSLSMLMHRTPQPRWRWLPIARYARRSAA